MQKCEIALDAVSKDANVDDVYYAIYCTHVETVPHPTLCVFAVKPAIRMFEVDFNFFLKLQWGHGLVRRACQLNL
jgi:hypothetical protein